MSERSSWGNFVAILLLLAAYAYAPILSMPIGGEDVPTVIGARDLVHTGPASTGDLYRVPGVEGRPGAAVSLGLSSWAWAGDGQWTVSSARRARVENLALLLLCSLFIVPLVRRALQPWTPLDQGKGAGFAAGLLFAVHPFAVLSASRLASRGDLLALAFALAALASFLQGRQSRSPRHVILAGVLTTLTGFFAGVDVFIPFAVAGLEFLSARRHRQRAARLRTTLNTFVAFAACVGLGYGLRHLLGATSASELVFRGGSSLDLAPPRGDGVVLGLEKLGLLILPVNSYGSGTPGYVFAGFAILIGLQPALVAGRWAPRLWGWILFGWILSIAATQVPDAIVRVEPQSLVRAEVLLVPSLVMALGLGISSTALSGLRRYLTPILMGLAYALLAHSGVLARKQAMEPVEDLHGELLQQVARRGSDTLFVVVDPPSPRAGYDPLGNVLPWLLHPSFLPSELERTERVALFGLDREALRAWVREPDFAAARQDGLVLLVPSAQLQGLDSDVDAEVDEARAGTGDWIAVEVPASEPSQGRRIWRGDGKSPSGVEFEPWTARSVVVSALPDIRTDDPPVLRWTARSTLYRDGEVRGDWIRSPDGPVGIFDLADHWEWLLGERVKRMWTTGSLASMVSTQVFAEPPSIPGGLQPDVARDDWTFDLAGLEVPRSYEGSCDLVLLLLDRATLDFVALPARAEGPQRVRFRGAEERVRQALEVGSGPVSWILEWRVGETTVGQFASERAAPSDAAGSGSEARG